MTCSSTSMSRLVRRTHAINLSLPLCFHCPSRVCFHCPFLVCFTAAMCLKRCALSCPANPLYLKTGRRFNAFVFTARLAAGEDDLSLLPFPHANFHLPEVVGMARAYELTENHTDKKVVDTFFDALWSNHSYATAGS